MIPDKKKAALNIIAMSHGGPVEGPAEYSSDHELKMIARDLLDAIKADSTEGIVSALKAFDACCEDSEAEEME